MFNKIKMTSLLPYRAMVMLTVISLLAISCEDYLEVDLPDSQLTGALVFQDDSTIEAALLDNYSKLRDATILTGSSSGLGVLGGLYTDELDLYSTSTGLDDFYTNSLIPTNTTIAAIWDNSYNIIYAANAIIEALNPDSSTSEEKRRIYGEALFQRALVHFYLSEIYGEIPYIKDTDYRVNSSPPKQTKPEIYNFIVEDLEEAMTWIPEFYLSERRTRPSSLTVQALLSRVHLYAGNYEEAINYSSELISSSKLELVETSNVFLNDSKETIWQFSPGNSENNSIEAHTYVFSTAPPPNYALTPNLVASFEAEDERFSNWIGSVADSTDIWYYAYKYKAVGSTSSPPEFSIVFRLAEQYLIRAEANFRSGNFDATQKDLNILRERAGLEPLEIQNNDNLKRALLKERRHELFTEFAHRWFDLRRLEELDQTLNPFKPGWEETDRIFPIPENEILLNPNLSPQNPGYN